jgi:hypothetical protein
MKRNLELAVSLWAEYDALGEVVELGEAAVQPSIAACNRCGVEMWPGTEAGVGILRSPAFAFHGTSATRSANYSYSLTQAPDLSWLLPKNDRPNAC